MAKRKGLLQKLSLVSGVLSFVLAFILGIILYLRAETVSSGDVISASLLASLLFCICVGAVLTTIGKTDLPSFKIDNAEKDKSIEG